MCVPSLNEIRETVFDVSCTQVKMYSGGATEVKAIYPKFSSGDINIYYVMIKSEKKNEFFYINLLDFLFALDEKNMI